MAMANRFTAKSAQGFCNMQSLGKIQGVAGGIGSQPSEHLRGEKLVPLVAHSTVKSSSVVWRHWTNTKLRLRCSLLYKGCAVTSGVSLPDGFDLIGDIRLINQCSTI